MGEVRKKKPEPIKDEVMLGKWMLTFSDLLTLMLTFFVLLFSMSSMDDAKFTEAFGIFSGAFGTLARHADVGKAPDFIMPVPAPVPERLVTDLQDLMDRHLREKLEKPLPPPEIPPAPEEYRPYFETEPQPQGLDVRIAGSALFEPGTANLLSDSRELLRAVASEVAALGIPVRVSSWVPPERDPAAAWNLSLDRAAAVTEALASVRGVQHRNLTLVGYAQPAPAELTGREGEARVILTFFTSDAALRESFDFGHDEINTVPLNDGPSGQEEDNDG